MLYEVITQRHYYKHLKGEKTSTNSVATIFAWTGALKKRGELDNNKELISFAEKLEKATVTTIEDGIMTGDLAVITSYSIHYTKLYEEKKLLLSANYQDVQRILYLQVVC